MKKKSICNVLIAIFLLFAFTFNSNSQSFDCSGTPSRADVCGGIYVTLIFSCRLEPPSLTGGLSFVYDATNTTSTIQGVTANADQAVGLKRYGETTPFFTVFIHATPNITTTTPGSRCDAGTVTLGATASAGTINWYSASSGGSSLGTGTSFTTPSISVTITYYADATNSGTGYSCTTSSRTPVVATVKTTPAIAGTTTGSRCGTGTVTLGATASAGTINWYDVSSGGTSLGTGTSFTTPSISATTTYYVDATYNGCTSSPRTAVTATVNTAPTIAGTTPDSRCDAGVVTLGASASAGTINWYTTSSGGTAIGTGVSFMTPSISSTTTYYVDATNNGCTTASRTSVTATVNTTPSISGTTPASRCGVGTLTLGATASAGTINWYSASAGGTSLGTGTTYTTPSLEGTTTYYVDATNNGCTSSPRIPVMATINTIPVIVGVVTGSRCGTGTITLGAAASIGTINWYDVSLGGTSLSTGTNYTTASLSATTTYYVDATFNGCTSSPRTTVTATVTAVPSITGTTPGSRCDAGSVTLGASASAGIINWYTASSGGTVIGNGVTFFTPSISVTTTYYADATDNGCTTAARTAVVATINTTPTITGTTPASRCGTGTVSLGASASAGTINWYSVISGGTSIATGTNYTTPSISVTTTYYVDATTGTCTTASRTAVTATVNSEPAATYEFVASTGCTGPGVTGITVTPVDAGCTCTWTAPGWGGASGLSVSCLPDNNTYTARVTNTASGCYTDIPILVKPKFNIALVLDRSGSMSLTPAGYTFTKWQLLKSDIDLLLGLISDGNITTMPGDSVSPICYNHQVTVYTEAGNSYFPAFKSLATETKVDAFMASLSPSGSTSIGGAVQTAVQPVVGRTNPVRVLLVTDGLQNTNPMIDASTYVIDNEAGIYTPTGATSPLVPPMDLDNFPGKDIRVYGIGIGYDCDHTLLNSIATATHGEYYSAFDPLYMTKSITEFYTDLFSIYSPQLINFYIDTLKGNSQLDTKEFKVSGLADKMIFFIAYNTDAAPSFELIKDNISIPISATLHTGSSYKMATLSFPMKIKGKTVEPCGSWYMKITGNKGTICKSAAIINEHKVKFSCNAAVKEFMIPMEVKIRGEKDYLRDIKITAQIFKPVIDAGDLLSNYSANAGKLSRLTVLSKDRSCVQTFRKKNPDFAGVSDAQVKWTMQSINKKIAGLFKLKPDAIVTFTPGKEGIFNADYKATLCGTYRINYTIEAKTATCESFYRTYTREVVVKPGTMSFENSSIVIVKTNPDYDIIIVRPKDKEGHLLGPGIGNTLTIKLGERLPYDVRDNLDGSYTLFYKKLSSGRFEGPLRIEQNKQLVAEKKIDEIKETAEPAEIIKLVSKPELVKKP